MPSAEPTLAELRRLGRPELDELYCRERPIEPPRGLFVGERLVWIAPPRGPLLARLLVRIGFGTLRFGIDFDRRRWFLFEPRLLIGGFDARVGRSRWRDTDTVQLHYGRSRLPAAIRSLLYDEVKPLGDNLCLGIGGIDAPVDIGDLFYFALARRRRAPHPKGHRHGRVS